MSLKDAVKRLRSHLFSDVTAALNNQQRILNGTLSELVELQRQQTLLLRALVGDKLPDAKDLASIAGQSTIQAAPGSFQSAMSRLPLLLDEKTYNTSHPNYDANLVRNLPGSIFNAKKPCSNPVYVSSRSLPIRPMKSPTRDGTKFLPMRLPR